MSVTLNTWLVQFSVFQSDCYFSPVGITWLVRCIYTDTAFIFHFPQICTHCNYHMELFSKKTIPNNQILSPNNLDYIAKELRLCPKDPRVCPKEPRLCQQRAQIMSPNNLNDFPREPTLCSRVSREPRCPHRILSMFPDKLDYVCLEPRLRFQRTQIMSPKAQIMSRENQDYVHKEPTIIVSFEIHLMLLHNVPQTNVCLAQTLYS